MPYCTQEDIEKDLDPATVIQLTDDSETGEVDTDNLATAIAKADTLIDGFLGGLGKTLPLDPVPNLIKQLSVDLSIWALLGRKAVGENTKMASDLYSKAIALLEKIQSGKIRLGISGADEIGPGEYRTDKLSTDRLFSKTILDKF